jgi:hypothetical protein
MNNQLELVNALLLLSKQCEHVAKLLSTNVLLDIQPNTELIRLPNSSKAIDVQEFEIWPEAVSARNLNWMDVSRRQAKSIGFNLGKSSILEYSNGPSIPIGHSFEDTNVELLCNDYKFDPGNQPHSVKIISSFEEAHGPYDIGIIYESLEFDDDPITTLIKIKQHIRPNGKIFIRFRPWSSRDGGFQSSYFNKSFAHLLIDLESNKLVKNKVVRPIAKYESIMSAAKLNVISRRINSTAPDDHIIMNKEYMDTLIDRTWGVMKIEEAVKIMSTTSVDFLVSV